MNSLLKLKIVIRIKLMICMPLFSGKSRTELKLRRVPGGKMMLLSHLGGMQKWLMKQNNEKFEICN